VTLVGDADRERALSLLRRHYAEGRLSLQELSGRVDVAAGARTSAEVRTALGGLPNAVFESQIAPRLFAAARPLTTAPAVRAAKRLLLAAILSALWFAATMVLAIALVVAGLAGALSGRGAVVVALCWLGVTWLSWRAWRRGSRRA
jgi:hypothetical protein